MPLSLTNKTKVINYYTPKKAQLLSGTLITTGAGRSVDVKEANYKEVQDNLLFLGINNRLAEVTETAGILAGILGRAVEIQAPPADNGASRKLVTLNNESSNVTSIINGVDVRLDNDQLKHQPPSAPIGTRHKGGGNRFNNTATAAWHLANTLPHMAAWANGLGPMNAGQVTFHGQAAPVAFVHYEGYCLMANGTKYVLFHCYPSNNSALKL
jgi:hypothetical protein